MAIRGWRAAALIRHLAVDKMTIDELAEMFDEEPNTVRAFKQRNRQAIQTCSVDIENEYAALWIAKKVNRIAELQADVDQINDSLEDEADPAMFRAKLQALRLVAEELGQLTQQISSTNKTQYEIVGVDMSKLI